MADRQGAGNSIAAARLAGASTLLVIAASIAGCASGGTGEGRDAGHATPDTGVHMDTGPMPDTGPRPDTGPPHDAGGATDAWRSVDASMACGTMVCTGFTHCVSGSCVAYPMCRGDGTCPTAGDVCAALRCVPGTVDIDGDGSPASMDCDETDPTRSPLAHEICNNRDDNCNMMIDDGDPAALCAMNPAHGVCMAGMCGCPAGTADVDLTVPGCECTIHPAATAGTDCTMPIDLGTVYDEASGGTQTATAMGNALPVGREIWYRFHATDVADTTCDNYNVHVALTVNPGSAYEFVVQRGMCGGTSTCTDCTAASCMNFTDYRYDVHMTSGMQGQCPCQTTPSPTVNNCDDDSADYFVRVRRHAGVAPSCDQYTLTVTNGMP